MRDRLRRVLPGYGHATFNDHEFGPGMNSISWRSDLFDLVRTGFRVASEGMAKVSPIRYVCWLVLRHKKSGIEFAVVNLHFVSKAFWEPPVNEAEWRLEQWHRNREVFLQVLRELRKEGLPVLVGGDLNRRKWDILSGFLTEFRYAEGCTVDRIAATDEITETEPSRLGPKNGSDHFSVISNVRIKGDL